MKDRAIVHNEVIFVFLSWVSNYKVFVLFVLNLSISKKKNTTTVEIHALCNGDKKNQTLLASSETVILLQSFCDFLLTLSITKLYFFFPPFWEVLLPAYISSSIGKTTV